MILKNLKLNNFLSHSNTEISLLDNQKFLLDGKSGAGKSSVIDALAWALYGRGRTENRSLIKRGKKYAKVIVTLKDKENVEYNITRSITYTGKHDLSVTYKKRSGKQFFPVKVSGIKNLQEYIEKKVLHSSYLLFLNSIIYPQDNIDNFVKQTAARRKEIILEIVNASDYDEYYEKAKDKVKELETVIGVNEVTVTNTEKKLKKDRENLPVLSLNELIIELDKLGINTKNKEKKLEIISEKKSEIDSVASEMSDKDKDLVNINDKTQKLITEIEDLNKKKNSLSVVDTNELRKNIESKKDKIAGFKALIVKANVWSEKMMELMRSAPVDKDYEELEKRLNSQIIDLMKKDIEICPEINKACPIIVREKDSRVVELSNSLDTVIKEKKEYVDKKANYDRAINDLGEKPIINNTEFSGLEISTKNQENRLKEIEQGTMDMTIEISVKGKELETSKKEASKFKNELEILGFKLNKSKTNYSEEEHEKSTKEYNNSISDSQELSQTIAVTKNETTRIEKEEKELKAMKKNIKNNKEVLESMKLLKEAFGNNGIKAIVIDYVIPRLEDKINVILSKLSSFKVCLDTQRKGINEDRVKEGLFIDIINENGEILDFDNYSGGEKMKINMAIFEALASLSHIDFRIFDETFLALDQESSENFLEVIKEIRKNVSQFICISHMPNIKDFFQEKINVVKVNGDSLIS